MPGYSLLQKLTASVLFCNSSAYLRSVSKCLSRLPVLTHSQLHHFSLPFVWLASCVHDRDRQDLVIPVSSLASIPSGLITFAVSTTNIFNVTSTSYLNVTKKDSSEAPVFELSKAQTQFYPSSGFRVVARPMQSPGCSALRSREVWEWITSIPGVKLAGIQGTSLVLTGRELLGKVEDGKVRKREE